MATKYGGYMGKVLLIDLLKKESREYPFSDEEREKFTVLLESGFIDTYRKLYPERVQYTWWSYKTRARERNVGWRIDYFVVSERLMPRVSDSIIYDDVLGSDHCPIGLIVD